MKKILLLGEGNFSFTRSLFTILIKNKIESEIYSTSYDKEEDVLLKYPEFDFICNELHKQSSHSCVRIFFIHSVNATNLNKNDTINKILYDEIIFNFPHLAVEDLFKHRSFLSHFFYSSKSLLKDHESVLTVALSQLQSQNWKLKEIAERNHYKFRDEVPINLSYWPFYELKRHHTGKSFQNRVDDCFHYCFSSSSSPTSSIQKDNNNDQNCFIRVIYDQSNQENCLNKVNTEKEILLEENKELKKNKKRKVHQLVEGLYTINESNSYQCTLCEKNFTTEQVSKNKYRIS